MEGYVILDEYLSPVFLALGIFGNAFMLTILLRWISKIYLHCNFCAKTLFCCKSQHTQWNNNTPNNPCSKVLNSSSNLILSRQMCIYLAFLAIADLGYLITMWLNQENISKDNVSCPKCNRKVILVKAINDAFKGMA